MLPVCVPALPPRASITRKLTRIDKKLTLICKDFILVAVVDDVHLISILVTLNMRVCGFFSEYQLIQSCCPSWWYQDVSRKVSGCFLAYAGTVFCLITFRMGPQRTSGF